MFTPEQIDELWAQNAASPMRQHYERHAGILLAGPLAGLLRDRQAVQRVRALAEAWNRDARRNIPRWAGRAETQAKSNALGIYATLHDCAAEIRRALDGEP